MYPTEAIQLRKSQVVVEVSIQTPSGKGEACPLFRDVLTIDRLNKNIMQFLPAV